MTRTHRPDEAQLRLAPQELEKLKAVVFDANSYSHARPDLDQLGRWAHRLAGMGIETWVPEPVAWEWAEHLVRDWQVVKIAAKPERRRLQSAGLEVPPLGYTTRDEVIAAVLTNLVAIPNVKIIEITGRSAVEGLKDQVLLRPPGKHKGNEDPAKAIKTGASDSAWIRDVLQLADPDELLFVTSDRDVAGAFIAWGKPAPNTRSLEELRPTLFDRGLDDGHARSAIIRYLIAHLPSTQQNANALNIGRVAGLEAAYSRLWEAEDFGLDASNVVGASLTGLVALAGIGPVRVEAGENTDQPPSGSRRGGLTDPGASKLETADAVVFFLAAGEATVQVVPDDDGPQDPQTSVLPISNVLVRAHLAFELADGIVTSVSADTDAAAMLLEGAFNESEEAETELVMALNLVPGITLEEGALKERQRFGIPGTDNFVVISVGGHHGTDWGVEIDLWHGGNEEEGWLDGSIGVECEYDPSTWYGGSREGFQGPGAFPVTVYGDELHERHGIWSLSAWLLAQIPWPKFPAPSMATQPTGTDDEPAET